MGAVHHDNIVVEEKFIFTSEAKRKVFITLAVGVIFFIVGVILAAMGVGSSHGAEHAVASEHAAESAGHAFNWIQRVWANLWLNNVYFTGISVIGLFFVAVNYVAWAGWSASIQRVPLSFGAFLPFTFVLMLIVFAFGHHDLFHWTHEYLYDPKSPHYDKVIVGKQGYLNVPFYIIRMVVFFTLWLIMFFTIRKNAFKEDVEGGVKWYDKNIYYSAVFLVIFAVSSSMASWDWVMSIDPHWFSTLFGWYMFASWFVAGLSTITLTVILLKEAGYLKIVNTNHLHDLGKFMFAFSIFWTYLWVAQFLLIYYSNLPEETIYFIERLRGFNNHYTGVFFLNVFINFLFPFLVLMTRDAKRQTIFLKIVSIALIFGHWLDFYMMTMPGTLKSNSGFGFIEIGAALFYVSLFMIVIGNSLTKGLLIAKNHPMLEESIHHDI